MLKRRKTSASNAVAHRGRLQPRGRERGGESSPGGCTEFSISGSSPKQRAKARRRRQGLCSFTQDGLGDLAGPARVPPFTGQKPPHWFQGIQQARSAVRRRNSPGSRQRFATVKANRFQGRRGEIHFAAPGR